MPVGDYPAQVMSDPLALLPFAIAAAGGRIDGVNAAQLVAAGLTLLQRGMPVVRALSGRRSGILLPVSPAMLVALAASDGRGALVLDVDSEPQQIAEQLVKAEVGAVFTIASLAPRCPQGMVTVLLDDAPREARIAAGGDERTVDLGAHFGLPLEGDASVPGRDEECLVFYSPGAPDGLLSLSHRALLSEARRRVPLRPPDATAADATAVAWVTMDRLIEDCLAPLLAGDSVVTSPPSPSRAKGPTR